MALARQRSDWDRFASLLAVVANCHAVKGRRFKPMDFHPFRKNNAQELTITRKEASSLFRQLASAAARRN